MWVVLVVSSFTIAIVFSMLGLGCGVLYSPLQVCK